MIPVIMLLVGLSAGITFVQLIRGPTVPDRIVAANAIGVMFFSLIVLLTLWIGADIFIDIALVYAVLQFVDVLVMAKYLDREGAKDR